MSNFWDTTSVTSPKASTGNLKRCVQFETHGIQNPLKNSTHRTELVQWPIGGKLRKSSGTPTKVHRVPVRLVPGPVASAIRRTCAFFGRKRAVHVRSLYEPCIVY